MLLELGFSSFNTLIHNCKVSFANRVAVCDNAVVFDRLNSDLQVVLLLGYIRLRLSVCLFYSFVKA